MFKAPFRVFCIVAAVFALAAFSVVDAGAEDFLGPIQAISSRGTESQRPAIAASSDGRRVAIAWDTVIDGARRVVVRENIVGEWLPEIIVDAEPTGDNHAASVAVDDAGNLHVAWLARVDESFHVQYANRVATSWLRFPAISGGRALDCEAVTVRLDPQGRPWIAWQTGAGSEYHVQVARLDDATGEFIVGTVSSETSLNLYPEIFFVPEPVVAWYGARDSQFSLMAVRGAAGEWIPYSFEHFSELPVNRLPYLFRTADGQFLATWYDEVDFADRVFLGMQDPVTLGAGTIIDHAPEAINHFVSGVASGRELIAVWCSETEIEGSQVFLSRGTSPPFAEDLLMSDGAKLYYALPRAAALPGGAVAVWQSSASEGGNGQIYVRMVAFR
jgi:hypothetical protein